MLAAKGLVGSKVDDVRKFGIVCGEVISGVKCLMLTFNINLHVFQYVVIES